MRSTAGVLIILLITVVAQNIDKSGSGGYRWNNILDNLLEVTQKDFTRDGHNNISLPAIYKQFENEVRALKLRLQLRATGGTLLGITSFRRHGDVHVDLEDSGGHFSGEITMNVTMKAFKVRYDHYELDIGVALKVGRCFTNYYRYQGPRGTIEASVGSNIIQVKYSFNFNDEFCAKLLTLRIMEVNGLALQVDGLGQFDEIISGAMTGIVMKKQVEMLKYIEEPLLEAARGILKTFDCSEAALFLL